MKEYYVEEEELREVRERLENLVEGLKGLDENNGDSEEESERDNASDEYWRES